MKQFLSLNKQESCYKCFCELFNIFWCFRLLLFIIIELTEITRQKDDQPFTELLNRFRNASHNENDIECIQSRSVAPTDTNYPKNAIHIFAENAPVDQHNKAHLECLSTLLHRLKAVDQYPPNVTKQDIDRVLSRGRSETGGLDNFSKRKC